MHFDKGSALNPQQHHQSVNSANVPLQRSNVLTWQSTGMGCEHTEQSPSHEAEYWKTASMLHRANDKLQELMQLLYLLGRDPAVPRDARYHVTVAQAEIALLTRLMQNAEGEVSDPSPPATSKAFRACNP